MGSGQRPARGGLIDPSQQLLERLRLAALDQSYVSLGDRRTTSVHEFYRYPARFSPSFARAAIEAFTVPGDSLLDPFVGGGTTLIEAGLSGRRAVGADLNSLAVFVTHAKAELRSEDSVRQVREWADQLDQVINMHGTAPSQDFWKQAGYLRYLSGSDTWRIRKAISQALHSLFTVRDPKARSLARLAILRTSQSVLDMRQEVPPVAEFRERLAANTLGMCDIAAEYTVRVRAASHAVGISHDGHHEVLHAGLPGLSRRLAAGGHAPPQLILTSPPYPGVYVLYHRWKLKGRKETPAPYWIANCLDGNGLAHYTMSARSDRSLDLYFAKLRDAFGDLRNSAGADTWFVQVVGFSDVQNQLERFLGCMETVGLSEVRLDALATADDGRCWRNVPGRRWWVSATQHGNAHTSREVVLLHRVTG